MYNKRASIPVTILVMLTLGLIIFALVSFKVSGDTIKTDIRDYNILENVYLIADYHDNSFTVSKELFNHYTPPPDPTDNPLKVEKRKPAGNVILRGIKSGINSLGGNFQINFIKIFEIIYQR